MEADHLSDLIDEGASQEVWDSLSDAGPMDRIRFLMENELDLDALEVETQDWILAAVPLDGLLVLALEDLVRSGSASSNEIFRKIIWERAGFADFTKALEELDASSWDYFERGPWQPEGWPLALYPAVIQISDFDCAVDVLEHVEGRDTYIDMFLNESDLAAMKVRTLIRLYGVTTHLDDIPDLLFAEIAERLPDVEAIGFSREAAEDEIHPDHVAALDVIRTRFRGMNIGASETVPLPCEDLESRPVFGCDVPRFLLPNGRESYLVSMHVQPTYSGLLGGKPNRSSNEWLLASSVREACRLFHLDGESEGGGRKPCLIEPARKVRVSAVPDRREGEDLPGVLWMARFRSGPIPSWPENEFSELVVLWFQEDFQFGPHSKVILQALDWDGNAWSYGVDDL